MLNFGRYGTDLATEFLDSLPEKHGISETVLLVDSFGYQTLLARLEVGA